MFWQQDKSYLQIHPHYFRYPLIMIQDPVRNNQFSGTGYFLLQKYWHCGLPF